MLKVSIIISNPKHPIFQIVKNWIEHQYGSDIELINRVEQLREKGDFLFLVSCSEVVTSAVTSRFNHSLVLHASDLPKGRGWSPHIWDVINGADQITLSLLEANDKVDTGKIWLKTTIPLDGTELYDEINDKLFNAEIELIEEALSEYKKILPEDQDTTLPSFYYPKRTPSDSELDPNKTLLEQLNLLRICDNERFPAFVEINGQKYTVKLEKILEQSNNG